MKIIHIGQRHKPKFEPGQNENVIQSQFRVAQKLKKYRDYPILHEGVYEDLLDASAELFSNVAATIFPYGFPTHFHSLTPMQQKFIHEYGAAKTLFWLGEIPGIYKSADTTIDTVALNAGKEGGDYDTVHGERDKFIVNCAEEVVGKLFKNTDDAVVIIVMGIGHSEALQTICTQKTIAYRLVDTVYKPTLMAQMQSAFFSPAPIPSTVPPELAHILKDGYMVQNCLAKGYITQEKLIELHQEKPWIVDALRCANIYNGICNNFIKVEQLDQLTEEQVNLVIHKFNDAELQEKVEEYVKLNRSQCRIAS